MVNPLECLSLKKNSEPTPSLDLTHILPSYYNTNYLVIINPNPIPLMLSYEDC